ncbi:MAG: DsbA family protein [Nitrososphaeria archaeon]|jgi:protein-disulfide isomerase
MDVKTTKLTIPVGERDHVNGPPNAPITLVEYGDFECPHCGRTYPIVKRLQEHLDGKLRFVFRHLPISTVHSHAKKAAEAAEAAGSQGKFWEMHDQLFEHQDTLDDENLRRYAIAVGLDIKRFDQEMKSNLYAPKVHEDFINGVKSGVNGTPTFFINGLRYNGPPSFEALLEAIMKEIGTEEKK